MANIGQTGASRTRTVSALLSQPKWLREAGQTHGAIFALLLLILFNAMFTTNYLSWSTLRVNLDQVATIVIVGVGMTLVIATGGIDLSVGALAAIAGSMAPLIFDSDRAPLDTPWVGLTLAIVLPILATGLLGLFNGFLVAYFRIQPIIATLVLYLGGRGIAKALSDGILIDFNNASFEYLGQGRPLGIPVQVILMAAIVAIATWVMQTTVFGRYVLATGGNEPAARLAGVPIARVKMAVYTISGLLAGLAGLIWAARISAADPYRAGEYLELDAIAAAAVGGTVMTGGRATILGTLLGAVIIQQVRFTLISHNVADGTTRIVIAVAIVLAVLVQRQRES